ncbi:hypothetical protein [Noviherbaspirillum sp.]|uniref:hypothetical protein n=1 Tax=Noviherbaspirillum sp. TaxID=1926288 RepID=UPI002D5A1EE1|nr:hypothetical protein [Noviherbaspirillum sp.]HZW19954.1 hypothetical protein [Noviherbaspirillum sp.]
MLMFDREQLRSFAQAAFVRRMRDVLHALSPAAELAEGDLDKEIAAQLKTARGYGFESERDCARWVLCAWCMGRDFDRKIASLAEQLKREDVTPAYKALVLELMLRSVFSALAGRSRAVP